MPGPHFINRSHLLPSYLDFHIADNLEHILTNGGFLKNNEKWAYICHLHLKFKYVNFLHMVFISTPFKECGVVAFSS